MGGQSNPLQTGGDETVDESQLELELCRLQRQLHVMEGDRRAYCEESNNLIRKQHAEIVNLRKESEEIGKVLKLAKNEKHRLSDADDAINLADLTEQLDDFNSQCEDEKRRIKDLDAEILNMEELINDERKFMGSNTEEKIEKSLSKRLRVTENRLDQHLVRFNKQLAENSRLREELEHLRQEKSVYDAIYKKLSKSLESTKEEMNTVITQASHAYEERDEAQNKMLALKERNDKDMAQQDAEMKELQRIIKHDNKLKEFMGIKVNDRVELKEEERIKRSKGKVIGEKESDLDKQIIQQLQQAFASITEATGEDDIDTIVHAFITKEGEIFALYNYVNELNDTVENLQDEISFMTTEIQRFQDDDVKHEEQRISIMREMEGKCIRYREEADKAEGENKKICKVLDELRRGITTLFKECYCDSSTINDMLGSEDGVTNKNILQYMGIIEQRTMELLQISQYIQMKKEAHMKQDKKDVKGQPTPPASQQGHRVSPRPQPVSIATPNTIDEDIFEDGGDVRPLTRNELKTVVLKMLNGISVSAQPGSKSSKSLKRAKAASPTKPKLTSPNAKSKANTPEV